MAADLLHRGLPTLPLRVEAAQATAQQLARRLAPWSSASGTPSADAPASRLVPHQMRGPGTVLAIDLGRELRVKQMLRRMRLGTHSVGSGNIATLVEHPARVTHRILDAGGPASAGITPGLIRIFIGLEHPDDLTNDLLISITTGGL